MTDRSNHFFDPLDPTLPPHFRCDCVPDLGPAHCHRCSRLDGAQVTWEAAECRDFATVHLSKVSAFGVRRIADLDRTETGFLDRLDEVVRTVVSAAFDTALTPFGGDAHAGVQQDAEAPAWPPALLVGEGENVIVLRELPREAQATAETTEPTRARPVPKPPAQRLQTAQERAAEDWVDAPWRFTDLALGQIDELGIRKRDVVKIAEQPELSAPANRSGTNHYGDGLMVLVDEDGQCIVSVVPRLPGSDSAAWAERAPERVDPKPGIPRAKSGGDGRAMPSTLKEMNALLERQGFHTRLGSGGHWVATHPDHPGTRITYPATPSDRRSYANCVAQVKRETGIDVTRRD